MVEKPLGQSHEGGMIVRWDTEDFRRNGGLRTSLPYETEEDRIGVLAIFESECLPGESLINTEIEVADYICGLVDLKEREDGSAVQAVRTVFLGPHQPPVSFVAKAALTFISRMSEAKRALPPWEPPVRVKIKQVPCKGGRTYRFMPVKPSSE